ncbi:hypothetical protein Cpar_1473 [Chlorobaculum parvum NCIB 8327]|uniref:Uncharacterized protein n=1 Tax=Chlorobaculum parvum (strain DSM 263 / NCIMB 8327) TaxID=517417 RepID=B3QPL8_CHLP8|nr:hypothetical protein Cpar_1473 [Chlorobaculum parvum NCIB 8327]
MGYLLNMGELITSLINTVTDLSPTTQAIGVSVMGVIGVWLTVKNLERKSGAY